MSIQPDLQIEADGEGGTIITFGGAPAVKRAREPSSNFDENLADRLDEFQLSIIAERTLEGIQNDMDARRDWEQTALRGIELCGIKLEEAISQISTSGSVSRVHDTALIEAVVNHWASSLAELLPAGGPAKIRDDQPALDTSNSQMGGPFPPAPVVDRTMLANAFEKDFNHYLLQVDKPFRQDFSRMLVSRALMGTEFRKPYRDPIRRRPVSRWVKSLDLIISPDAADLSDAARVTERIFMRQSTARRMMANGQWRDIDLVTPNEMVPTTDLRTAMMIGINPRPNLPPDHRHEIYECYQELDEDPLLDDETGRDPGYPLPYRVTLDKDSRRVVEIRRNWKEGDQDHLARERYVKYGFVPGFYGIYDIGLVHMIGNPQRALTAMERLGIDAGMFASFPGGFISKGPGSRTDTVDARVPPGTLKVLDTGGKKIQDVVELMPYKGADPTLLAMRQDVKSDTRRLAGTVEMPVGEGRVGDVPVQTIMAYIESITKVPSAVHKDDHVALSREMCMMRDLLADDPTVLWKFATNPARRWQIGQEIRDQELVPASDPNTPSQPHRLMMATAILQMASMPGSTVNRRKAEANALAALGRDPAAFQDPLPPPGAPPPPPDPKTLALLQKSQADEQKNQTQLQVAELEHSSKMAQIEADQETRQGDRQSRETIAQTKLAGDVVKERGRQHTETQALAVDHAHHVDDQSLQAQQLNQQKLDQAAQPPAPDQTGP